MNFETNFYTQAEPFTRTVTLLGRKVDFDIEASGFTWNFGDGQSRTTDHPGAAYPDLLITHRYLDRGTVSVNLTTTYTADYRVDGGAWQVVPGQATVPGTAVSLQVLGARAVLTAPQTTQRTG